MFPIKEIMATKVITIGKDASIYEAARLLVEHNITGLPVIDESNRLVGIISEFDMLRLLAEGDIKKEHKVESFMTAKVISFEDTITAIEASEFFLKNPNKRRVPITHDGKLVGLVTRGDIVKLLVGLRKQSSKE